MEILFSPGLLASLAVFSAVSLFLGGLHEHLADRYDNRTSAWLWEHFYLPTLRAGALLLFLALAYPVLFGLTSAPPLLELMSSVPGRFGLLLGIVYLLSLLLPLLPFKIPTALVLPIQAIAAAAVLFTWLVQATGTTNVSWWPGTWTAALMLGSAAAAHWLPDWLSAALLRTGSGISNREDLDLLMQETLRLFFQVPIILAYTVSLGRQL